MTFRTTQMSTATGELPGKKLSQEPGADTARAWGGRRPRSPPGRPGTASTSASLLLPHLQSQPDLHPAARSPLQSQLPVPHAAGLPQHPHLPPPHPCAELLCPSPLPEAALAQVTPGPRTAPPPPPACGSIQQPPHSSHFPCPGQHFYSVQKQKQKQRQKRPTTTTTTTNIRVTVIQSTTSS